MKKVNFGFLEKCKNNFKFYFAILFLVITNLIFTSCGDPVPLGDYQERYLIEAFIFVGQPINDIAISKSQNLTDTFRLNKSYKEGLAQVKQAYINELDANGNVIKSLKLIPDSLKFYAQDTSYLVKENTKYTIRVEYLDGEITSGETFTPMPTAWDIKYSIKKEVQFPFDSLSAPPTDTIAWLPISSVPYYIIAVKCMDTLEYGKYTPNQNEKEKNRRINRPIRGDNFFKDQTSLGFLPTTKTPVVWSIFKWFGKHEIYLYAPDYNTIRWFLQNRTSREYNSLLSSVKSTSGKGIGVFGSSSVIKDTFFLVKNRP